MGIPIHSWEQMPEKIGKTSKPIIDELLHSNNVHYHKKSCFSGASKLTSIPCTTSFLLCGIEAHICVMQTALELLQKGHEVYICVDAVSSINLLDKEVALRRLFGIPGCVPTTVQSALFEILGGADDGQFKAISELVKGMQ